MTYNPYLPPIRVGGEPVSAPIVFWDDFTDGWGYEAGDTDNTGKFSEIANLGQWLVTVLDTNGAGIEVVRCADSATGGWLTITTNTDELDTVSMQLNGEAFKMGVDKKMIFEIRAKFSTATAMDWFVGLAVTDTAILTGVTDRIGFECPDATGDIDAVTEKNSTQTSTDTTIDLADDTFVVLRFEVKGTGTAKFFVDGVLKATHTTNLPNDLTLTPSMEIGATTDAAYTMTVDYILVWLQR